MKICDNLLASDTQLTRAYIALGVAIGRRSMSRSESRREAFRRLATKRTNAVLDKLRVLGHCANPHLYEYSDEDVKKIFRTIEAVVKETKSRFQNTSKSEFQL